MDVLAEKAQCHFMPVKNFLQRHPFAIPVTAKYIHEEWGMIGLFWPEKLQISQPWKNCRGSDQPGLVGGVHARGRRVDIR